MVDPGGTWLLNFVPIEGVPLEGGLPQTLGICHRSGNANIRRPAEGWSWSELSKS